MREHTGIGVFKGRAGGKASGESGNFYASSLEKRADIEGGAVADHIGIGGHNNFLHPPCFDSLDELIDCEVGGLNAI